MPPLRAVMAFSYGAAFGLLPVGWTIFNTMLLYNVTVQTGQFDIVRRSVASLSSDARIQAILIAFAFGAFLEGAAGGGTPVAICGAILVGLGFDPFKAAVLCLIANTSPVAFGGLSTPLITLNGVTGIPTETLSIMAGHQLPFFSLFVPLYMVRCMCSWKQTREVWPALLVSGGSFRRVSARICDHSRLRQGLGPLPHDGHRRGYFLPSGDGRLSAVLAAADRISLRRADGQ
jgi:lactate permease